MGQSQGAKYELIDLEAIDNYIDDEANENNEVVDESLSRDAGEAMDDDKGECSDGWLLSGDEKDNVEELWLASDGEQNELTNNDEQRMEDGKELQSKEERGPDVKVSAITGVGLQELLEIMDERLKVQDNQQKATGVVERDFETDIFNRKWRPEASIKA